MGKVVVNKLGNDPARGKRMRHEENTVVHKGRAKGIACRAPAGVPIP